MFELNVIKFSFRCVLAAILMAFVSAGGAVPAQAQALVEPSWLKTRLTDPAIVIIDLRREDEYLQRHIPGAVWSPYGDGSWYFRPAMGAPTPGVQNALAARMGQLGVSAQPHVILVHAGRIYNHPALAAQVYWTLKYAGHKKISILHGGMRAYLEEPGATVTNQPSVRPPSTYATDPGSPTLAVAEDVREAIKQKSQIIDVRARGQFLGINKIDEVDRYGTITSAVHFPAAWLTTDGGGRIRPVGELQQLFTAMKIDPAKEVIFISDTGTMSALAWFAAHEILGNKKARHYAPGLLEWARNPENPMERRFIFK